MLLLKHNKPKIEAGEYQRHGKQIEARLHALSGQRWDNQADILDRLMRDGPQTLQAMFTGRKSRSEMIGLFLAMLELIRMKKIIIEQDDPDRPIALRINPDAPPTQAATAELADGSAPVVEEPFTSGLES